MLNSLRLGKWYSHTCGNDVPAFTVLSIKTNGSDVPVNGSDVPVLHPLAIATNFYGIDYSELPVHGGRTIIQ